MMVIFDYERGGLGGNDLGLKLENGVLKAQTDQVIEVQFKNFPKLEARDLRFQGCEFEACGHLEFNECNLEQCSFRQIEKILSDEAQFIDCRFENLEAEEDPLLEIYTTKLQGCRFNNIVLREEAYLCDAYPDCSVERCTFTDCWTDRDDFELFLCEETVGKLFKRKKWCDILDDFSSTSALRGCNQLED